MTTDLRARCKDCVHWDADNQIALPQEENVTVSSCTLPKENDYSAPMTIGHHRLPADSHDCQVYLITKSNFYCSSAQRRNGLPERRKEDPDEEETVAEGVGRKAAAAVANTTLWMADLTLDYMLRRRQGERTIRPTKRITFPPKLRRQLLNEQNGQCMYCGARKSVKTTDVDHMHPVVRRGPNESSNLQILCKPCNQRKGMQTDEEFRERYAKLLPRVRAGQKPTPPQQAIPQKEFRRVTKETQMANSAREFNRTKYISPRQKISGGTPVAGAIMGGMFFFGTALALPQESWAGNVSLVLGLATGVGTWAGLMLRAKITGKLDM